MGSHNPTLPMSLSVRGGLWLVYAVGDIVWRGEASGAFAKAQVSLEDRLDTD